MECDSSRMITHVNSFMRINSLAWLYESCYVNKCMQYAWTLQIHKYIPNQTIRLSAKFLCPLTCIEIRMLLNTKLINNITILKLVFNTLLCLHHTLEINENRDEKCRCCKNDQLLCSCAILSPSLAPCDNRRHL